MQSIKQFQNDEKRIYASVVSEPRQGLLMDIWSGQYKTKAECKQVLDYSLSSLSEYNLVCWLSDISQLEEIFQGNTSSLENDVFNQLLLSPLKKLAVIKKGRDVKNADKIIQVFIRAGIEVKQFSTSIHAMQWLLQSLKKQQSVSLV